MNLEVLGPGGNGREKETESTKTLSGRHSPRKLPLDHTAPTSATEIEESKTDDSEDARKLHVLLLWRANKISPPLHVLKGEFTM